MGGRDNGWLRQGVVAVERGEPPGLMFLGARYARPPATHCLQITTLQFSWATAPKSAITGADWVYYLVVTMQGRIIGIRGATVALILTVPRGEFEFVELVPQK